MAISLTEKGPVGHVLVAEDNADLRAFIKRALEGEGHTVTLAVDGQQALALLARPQVTFDLLLTDIVMPQVDGIALALKAVRLHPDMKIIMISGYPQERMRAHNLKALVQRIVPKPFSLEEICTVVREGLDSRATGV